MASSDAVQLTLELESAAFTAGEELRGEVRVRVNAAVSCRCIRLSLVGKEVATLDQVSESFTSTAYYMKRYVYLSRSNERTEGGHRALTHFEPGFYLFPFHVRLEARLPPTYYTFAGPAETRLRYMAEAEMVFGPGRGAPIRHGCVFTVRSCANPMQVSTLRQGGKRCVVHSPVFRHSCLLCFWGDAGGEVRADVGIVPGVYALYQNDNDAQHGTPNPEPVFAKVKLQNSCSSAIFDTVEIVVRNVVCIPFDIQNRFYTSKVAFDGSTGGCNVEPGDEDDIIVPLTRRLDGFATSSPAKGFLPSMQSAAVISVYIVEVRIKGLHSQDPLVSVGQLEVAEVTSAQDTAPALPYRYLRLLHPEPDAAFIPTARDIELPHDVFPEEPAAYLPRPADYPLSHAT
ncbi:hypothetical protein STCU_10846 [Strigomonas culicis]|uniref:Arrestin-like N-terminal domain-containing protein n=1 Tax=Strigomonas culicis TaxID=28005 RepID=S9UR31_9TRYP|nr:hypothetical protein STCU_10846 [Strigomonas culicis]|eukprot:EPY17056.1 hypothetical protein STCU_10846 [Strigomonas culicis]